MRRILLVVALAVLPITTKAEPFIAFLSLHNLDAPKIVCEQLMSGPGASYATSAAKIECTSERDLRVLGRQLELDVQSKFATDPRCAGVTIVRGWYPHYDAGNGSEYSAVLARDHWDLMLDYLPDTKKYGWHLYHGKGSERFLKDDVDGEGTPAQIADAACIAAKGLGATIR